MSVHAAMWIWAAGCIVHHAGTLLATTTLAAEQRERRIAAGPPAADTAGWLNKALDT